MSDRRPSIPIPDFAGKNWRPRCPICGRLARLVESTYYPDEGLSYPIVDCSTHGEQEGA